MTIQAIINLVKSDGGSWLVVFLILSSLIEVSPIKINPISAVCKWLSSKFNQPVMDKINDIEKKLDNHISESESENLRNTRQKILSFGTSCLNDRKHTREEYEFIISECDKYEAYCTTNNIPNGVATATIVEIRRCYQECLHNNSFLL